MSVINACMSYDCFKHGCIFSDLDVGACILKNLSIELFNISFESTQNKQLYDTKQPAQR